MILNKKPWSHDVRSKKFSHTKYFGTVDVNMLPVTLGRPRTIPENQGNRLRCAAVAGAMNGQYIHGIRMSHDWQEDKISRIQGKDVDTEGSDPNAAMSSQMYDSQGGYLPYPDWKEGVNLDAEAQDYSDISYLKPDGGKDIFDSIKIALYMAYDPIKKLGAGAQAFSGWYDTFTNPNITSIGTLGGYHSYLFMDFDTLNGEQVLVLENSYGEAWGDKGYQTMTRTVVNQLFSQWGTALKIPKPLTKEQLQLAKEETPYGKIQRQIINIWYAIINYLASIGR